MIVAGSGDGTQLVPCTVLALPWTVLARRERRRDGGIVMIRECSLILVVAVFHPDETMLDCCDVMVIIEGRPELLWITLNQKMSSMGRP